MENKKKSANPESREALYTNMGKIIESFSPILKENLIIKNALDEIVDNKVSIIYDALLSLNIYIQYVNIELAFILRACFRANLDAEKRYSIKWINCIILESYKYLYGYGNGRKKSLWVSKVKPILKVINDQEFEKKFISLENQVIKFGESNITNLMQRDLSFHYDLEPLLVYNMLMGLSEEEEVRRMISFMDLLQNISFFTSKYIIKYKVYIDIKPKSILKYAFTLSDFDIFRNGKDELYLISEDTIKNHAQRLEKLIHQQSLLDAIHSQFKNIDKNSMAPVYRIIEIQKVAIQLTFLYIDLASALRAFISSEYTIEKQLSVKQVNIIIYEGFNKLYGINDSQDSFWNKYISPIISESVNETTSDEFNSIEQEFQTLKLKIKTFSSNRQLSVHLHEGIPKVYSMLHYLNPIEELQKALLLLNFLPKILNFLTGCLHLIDLKNQVINEKRIASNNEQIDKIISLLKKVPNNRQKDDLIKMLDRFKNGEFFDEIKSRKKK